MPYAAVNDLRMYYEEHGNPDGPPLVLLHGFTATGRLWQSHLAAFGSRYRLIVPDLRSHGRTDNPGGLAAMTHRQFARDIVSLCREHGLEQAIFCGQSSGAMLLLTLAVEAPGLARALVLSAGTYFYSEERRARWRSQTPETHVPEGRRTALQEVHTAVGEESWRRLAEAFLALGDHAHEEDFPEPEELRGIRAPALIIHGDRDEFFPAEVPVALYRLIPESELCILPNAGHGLPRTQAERWRGIVLDFLTRRVP